jgi:hypothetical protein
MSKVLRRALAAVICICAMAMPCMAAVSTYTSGHALCVQTTVLAGSSSPIKSISCGGPPVIQTALVHGDGNYTIPSNSTVINTSAVFTAPRTWTLPSANSVGPGKPILIMDAAGGVTSTNTLTVAAAGSDTVPGGTTSATAVLSEAYGSVILVSDGVSKWTARIWQSAAAQRMGTSGHTVPYNDGANTHSGSDNFAALSANGEPITFNNTWHNISMGVGGLPAATSSNQNSIGIGDGALANDAAGSQMTAEGYLAGYSVVSGRTSSFYGYVSGYNVTSPDSVSCFGAYTCGSCSGDVVAMTGIDDTVGGEASGCFLTTGSYDTLDGFNAGFQILDGSRDSAYGQGAMQENQSGTDWVSVGNNSGEFNKSSFSVFVGSGAGQGKLSTHATNAQTNAGSSIVYFSDTSWATVGDTVYNGGCYYTAAATILSIVTNTSVTLSSNAIINCPAGSTFYDLYMPNTGNYHVGIGGLALNSLQGSAANDIAIGGQACRYLTIGSNDICLGFNAGGTGMTAGSNDICMGLNCAFSDGTLSNQLDIENFFYCVSMGSLTTGKCGIGNIGSAGTPAFTLEVGGTVGMDALTLLSGTANYLCIDGTTHEVKYKTTSCGTLVAGFTQYAWASRPAASSNTGVTIEVTDIGPEHCFFTSDGTDWVVDHRCTLARAAVQIAHTGDTTEYQEVSVNVPAGVLGHSGTLEAKGWWTFTSSTNQKNVRIRWPTSGGTAFCGGQTNTSGNNFYTGTMTLTNRAATNSQEAASCNQLNSSGFGNSVLATSSIDTTVVQPVVFTGQLANSGESVNLERYEVWITP